MPYPADFQFSQSSLQDYLECPRRFELRYLKKLQWPAIKTEPILELEHRISLGTRFHQAVQQSLLNIPYPDIELTLDEVELKIWWENYTHSPLLVSLPTKRYPERAITATLDEFHLIAKYDLLAVDPGRRLAIIDWKTSSHRTPSRRLHEHIQTRLYPFLLAKAGDHLNGHHPVEPEQVEMIYWFTGFPNQPEQIHYSLNQYISDQDDLLALLRQIAKTPEGMFLLTADEKKCAFCQYRSLCNRGQKAGNHSDLEDDEPDGNSENELSGFNFDQIGEIEF